MTDLVTDDSNETLTEHRCQGAAMEANTVQSVHAVSPGRPRPLGATSEAAGTNFAVTSSGERVWLCLFDTSGLERRIELLERDGDTWHAFIPGITPGQAYGYRVAGPYDPNCGMRFNPAKLLLDPYAKAIDGQVQFGAELLGHNANNPAIPSDLDSAVHVPRSLVVAAASDHVRLPATATSLADSVIYELHVKGFTQTHPDIPEELRGTYAGLAHPAALRHLTDLGVTTIELLPVHHHVPEEFLADRNLTNYWGYNTIGFFAPHAGYSAAVRASRPSGQVAEFKSMVDAVHAAGLEIILDVVFNHTAEAGADGPTLCHRGLDNPAYYRLDPADPSCYIDTTGCGNSLNAGNPVALALIMDSLRYWLTEMGVDGFRFDLAPTLARPHGDFDPMSAFFEMVAQDPVVSRAKLIAEPWDVGSNDSYDVGAFPALWSEWNGKYRDTVRDFWRSHNGLLPEFASRMCGSADLYATRAERRRPDASINLITVHDGFTLVDLVSYDRKHNEANGENNRDGSDDNRSWNCGVEGPTTLGDVLALRLRQRRALLTTLLLSAGVPLLLGGDELGRTQHGNNNAYCQDNAFTWYDWADIDRDFLQFSRQIIELRRAHPAFRRRRYLTDTATADLQWFTPAGTPMTATDWADPQAHSVALLIDGANNPDQGADGQPLIDDDFLILINAWWQPLTYAIAAYTPDANSWQIVCNTHDPLKTGAAGDNLTIGPRSIAVLQSTRAEEQPRGVGDQSATGRSDTVDQASSP